MDSTVAVNKSWTATDIIAWVTFIILLILIILVIFYFFFGGNMTSTSQNLEIFGANYLYVGPDTVNNPPRVSTSGNTIYIVPNVNTGTVLQIVSNNFNVPGRTFLIKNESSAAINLQAGPGVTLYTSTGTAITSGNSDPTTLDQGELAMYITNRTNPQTEFRRLL